jgi:ribosomal protection tetracycline resistance protein
LSTRTLNLGILAHVDAGKTSLTERLLFEHGVIAALGSVDAGSTSTDSGELERERGITIRSAVASFPLGDLRVNLVDTPGHPDFIAEVERALAVLDAVVLVVSAVEGVQAQTRVLMRCLRGLGLPTLIFVNKIDRRGARPGELPAELRTKLGLDVIAMNAVRGPGLRSAATVARAWQRDAAEALAEHDDDLLGRLVDGGGPAPGEVDDLLVAQTGAALVHPVYFGSAMTGAGVAELVAGVARLLRPRPVTDAGTTGLVFAVERAPSGEKLAYLRLFSGELRDRQRVTLHRPGADTEIKGRLIAADPESRAPQAPAEAGPGPTAGPQSGAGTTGVWAAGSIARVRGLPGIRVGDRLGHPGALKDQAQFSPPSLESLVRALDPAQQVGLHAALSTLADEDPLIRTRAVPGGGTSVLLYGAVQREVITERLARDFGIRAVFGEIRPVYVERVTGTGEATIEMERFGGNEFWATIGLRVEPGTRGAGLRYSRDVEWGALPRAFHKATEEAVRQTLEQGLYGWEVLDCAVTVIRTGYASPISVAADFRGLAPIVLRRALRRAGTRVHEPCLTFEAEIPADTLSPVLARLAGLGAEVSGCVERGPSTVVTGLLAARQVPDLTATLPGLTHGEGALWTTPGPDRPPALVSPPRR